MDALNVLINTANAGSKEKYKKRPVCVGTHLKLL